MKQTTIDELSSSHSQSDTSPTTSDDGEASDERPDPDYDPEDLRQLQQLRAAIDPIPVHPKGTQLAAGSPSGGDTLSPAAVLEARYDRVAAQDSPQPIKKISWEEAMLCMRSTFNDARFATTPAWVGAIKHTFQQYLSTSLEMDPEEVLPASVLNGPPVPDTIDPNATSPTGEEAVIHGREADSVSWMPETDQHRAIAEGFRRQLKHVRDRLFLAEYYDDLVNALPGETNVPQLVWREAALANARAESESDPDSGEDDAGAQTGLGMF